MARLSLLGRYHHAAIPIPLITRIFLGGYFVYAALNKLADPFEFLKGAHLYGLLPESPGIYLNLVALVLPWMELICGVALMIGAMTRAASLVVALMLLVFTPAIIIRAVEMMQSQGIPFYEVAFDCGCGSGLEIIWIKTVKNAGLLILALLTLLSGAPWLSVERLLVGRADRPVEREPAPARLAEVPLSGAKAG